MTRRRPYRCVCGLLLSVAFSSITGCGDGDADQFDGQTATEWIAQAKNGKAWSRLDAYRALRAFPKNKQVIDFLEKTVTDDVTPFTERVVAAQSLYRATGDTSKVVPQVGRAIRQQADAAAGGGAYSTKELEEFVSWLGVRAEPLTADLQYARSRLSPRQSRGAATTREQLEHILQTIPKT